MSEKIITHMHILDGNTGRIVHTLDNTENNVFWGAEHKQVLKGENVFEFYTDARQPVMEFLQKNFRVLIPKDGEENAWMEFVALEYDTDQFEFYAKMVGSEIMHNKEKVMEKKDHVPLTPFEYAGMTETKTFKRGTIEYVEPAGISFGEYLGPFDYNKRVASTFNLELEYYVVHDGYEVTGRYYDMVKRLGVDEGKIVEPGKDLLYLRKSADVQSVVTALFCIGPEKEDGTHETVLVTNEQALQEWNWQGEHLIDIYTPESSNETMSRDELAAHGTKELNKRIAALYTYEAPIESLEHIYKHERARLGDSIGVVHRQFNPPIYATARVLEITRRIDNPKIKNVVIGEIKEQKEAEVLKTFRELQQLYGLRVIRSATPPPGDPNKIWLQLTTLPNGKEIEVPHAWSVAEGRWIPMAPTTADDIGAETPTGAQEKADDAERKANDHTDEVGRQIRQELSDLETALGDFETTVNEAFRDGVIEEAEAKAIEKYLNTLEAEKAAMDTRYSAVYGNVDLTGTAKTALATAKTNFNSAHTNLIQEIQTAIADGKTTTTEKDAVDASFVTYRSRLSSLSTALEAATNAIASKKAADAEARAKTFATEKKAEAIAFTQEYANRKISQGDVAPENPELDDMWIDTSDPKLHVWKRWNGTEWVNASVTSLSELRGVLDEAQLAVGSINTGHIADDAITSVKIGLEAVGMDKIQNGAITDTKLAALAVTAAKLADGAVTTNKILSGAVIAAKIADGAVESAKIKDAAITGAKLFDKAVTFEKLADLSVDVSKIRDGAVTSDKIVNGAITNVKLGNLSVDAAKIAAGAVTTDKVVTGAITNVKLGNLAVDAAKIAAGAVTSDKVVDGAISAVKIADAAVNADKLAAGAVTTAKILDGAIAEAKLAAGAVTEGKIFNGAITSDKLAALSVEASKLAAGAVTEDKIAMDAVTNEKLADLAVQAENLANGAVTGLKILDGAVAAAKIASGAVTELKLGNGAVTNAKLGNLAVDAAKLANSAVTATKIANLAVGTAAIADGAITNAKITNLDAGKITTGRLDAARIQIGDGTLFADGFDPTTKETPAGALAKANAAQTAAISAAATDAKEKADAAEAAAKAAASTDAAAKAAAAEAAAKAAAAADAKEKADAAQAAAISAAGTDATAKAAAAESAAKTAAAADAAAKAAAAESAAKTAAAADATAKANAAQTAAEAAAKTYSDQVVKPANDRITLWQYANTTFIDGGNIYANSVTANQIAAGTITAASGIIADAAITSAKIANLAVGTAAIANSAITNAKIANLAVDAAKIKDAAITSAKIANLAVGTAAIQDAAITNAKVSELDAAKITTGRLDAARVQIGSGTQFAAGFDPTTKQTADERIDNMLDYTNLPYKADLVVYGDSDKYYPVYIWSGNQNVMRTIKIWRSYSERGPDDWNTPTHKGSLMLTWRGNFGGWGGADYKHLIEENSSQYTELLADTKWFVHRFGYIFFLRGGGPDGAIYHFASDQDLTRNSSGTEAGPIAYYNGAADKVYDHPTNDTYDRNAEEPMTAVNKTNLDAITLIRSKDSKDYADAAVKPANDRLTLWQYTDTTFIDGGRIYANSVTANQIAAGTITATQIAGLTITGDKIAANAITAAKIVAGTITATEISSSAITADKIATNAVTAVKISAGAVATDKLAANAVTAAKIAAGTITAAEIAGLTITGDKIAANAITAAKISAGAVTANEIATNAITAVKILAGAIETDKLATNAVTAAKIAAGTITAAEIAGLTITGDKIAANAITAAKISAGAVTANEIASNAITSVKINAGAVETDKLAANAVTAAKIAANSVTATHIAGLTITANEIAANAITTAKIATNAVTANEIAAGTITATQIASNAITSDKILANAITAGKIAANGVTADNIAAGAVTASKLAVSSQNMLYDIDTFEQFVNGEQPPGSSGLSTSEVVNNIDSLIGRMALKHVSSGVNSYKYLSAHGNNASGWARLTAGKRYVLSAYVKTTSTAATTVQLTAVPREYDTTTSAGGGNTASKSIKASDGWTRISLLTGTITGTDPALTFYIRHSSSGVTSYWVGFMLEEYNGVDAEPSPFVKGGTVYIHGGNVVANTITASQIAAGSITAASGIIADAAITSAKIADLAVGTAAIANAAITNAKISSLDAAKITTGTLAADRIGANSITATHIAGRTITASQIATGTITANELRADSVTASKIAADAVTATKIAAGAVTANAIAANSITSNMIATAGLDAGVIKFGTMSGDRILSNSIDANRLKAGSIIAEDITFRGKLASSSSLGDEFLQVQGTRVSAHHDTYMDVGRTIFNVTSTLLNLYDGDAAKAEISTFGKVYVQTINVPVPAASYTTNSWIGFTVNIKDYYDVGIYSVNTIFLQPISREWRTYEIDNGRVFSGGDLKSFNARIHCIASYTSSGTTVPVQVLIIGQR